MVVMEVRRVGISKLIYSLFSERFNSVFVDYKKVVSGRWLHKKYGFDQQEIRCEGFYKYKGQLFYLQGTPDYVDYRDGKLIIAELKTYRHPSSRDLMGIMGWLQANVYAYLLNIKPKKLEVLVESYVMRNGEARGELELYLRKPADYKLADWTIRRGLDVLLRDSQEKEEVLSFVQQRIGNNKEINTLEEYLK